MDAMQRPPSLDEREIVLVAVTGESPAVLTETAWALARERPPCRPRRVVAITTSIGAERLRKDLVDSGVWEGLRRELKARPGELLFGASDSIRVIGSRREARDLADIVSAEDHFAAADAILETVRGFTANPETRVVASLAGGRKTMGAFMALALTLVGRPEDRLCHVLVNAPFDSPRLTPRFFYPPRKARVYALTDPRDAKARRISSRQARIALAEVPFVPLARLFERDLRQPAGGYAGLVARLRGYLAEGELPLLHVECGTRRLRVANAALVLNPQEFAMLDLAIRRRLDGAASVHGWKDFSDALKSTGAWAPGRLDEPEEIEHLRKLANSIRRKLQQALRQPDWVERLALTRERGVIGVEWPASRIARAP